MTAGPQGEWRDGFYVPEPSVRRFEEVLGRAFAAMRCAACGKPLGEGPMIQADGKKYHPACWRQKEKT